MILSPDYIAKIIGIEYCNTFIKKVLVLLLPIVFLAEYLYWYWQYFMKVLLTTLSLSH